MLKDITVLLVVFSISLFAQTNEKLLEVNDAEVQKAADLYNMHDYGNALNIVEEIIDEDDENAEAYYVLSKTLFAMDELSDAIDAAEEAVELNNDNINYHLFLVNLYGIDIRNASIFRAPSLASSMKEELLTVIKLDPKNVAGHNGLVNFYLQAPGIMGGSVDKAFEHANILLSLDEMSGRFALANIYAEEGELDKVESEYIILDEKFGDNPEIFAFYNGYGYFLLNQNRIDEAIEKFKKQVELAPDNANAHDSLGEGYLKKGMLEESLAEYKKALEIDPHLESAQNKVEEIEYQLSN